MQQSHRLSRSSKQEYSSYRTRLFNQVYFLCLELQFPSALGSKRWNYSPNHLENRWCLFFYSLFLGLFLKSHLQICMTGLPTNPLNYSFIMNELILWNQNLKASADLSRIFCFSCLYPSSINCIYLWMPFPITDYHIKACLSFGFYVHFLLFL